VAGKLEQPRRVRTDISGAAGEQNVHQTDNIGRPLPVNAESR
jgi:hypothetical protein